MKLTTVVLAAGAAAVGYVLGTRAGRAQFEQIKAKAGDLAHDPRVRSGVSNLAGEVRKNADKLPDPVAGVVRTAADMVESAANPDEGSPTTSTTSDPLSTTSDPLSTTPDPSPTTPPSESNFR